jgi:hypothetical protein
LCACLLLVCGLAHAGEPPQTVSVHATFGDRVPERVEAVVQQVGEQRVLALVDDGSDPVDARGDRVWSGSVRGAAAQYLPIGLRVTVDGVSQEVWSGVVRAGLEPAVDVSLEVVAGSDGALVGRRRASTAPGRVAHATEALPLLAAAFWTLVCVVYAGVLARLAGAPVRAEGPRDAP